MSLFSQETTCLIKLDKVEVRCAEFRIHQCSTFVSSDHSLHQLTFGYKLMQASSQSKSVKSHPCQKISKNFFLKEFEMEQILDFQKPLDVTLFDDIVQKMYFSQGIDQQNAQKILNEFQQNPLAWDRVEQIFTNSKVMQSKYLGLQVLETMVKTAWKVAIAENREGIKNFVISNIIQLRFYN